MTKYIATVLIDVDNDLGFKHKRSCCGSVKGLLEKWIKTGEVTESVFRNGEVVMNINEVKITVMEIG